MNREELACLATLADKANNSQESCQFVKELVKAASGYLTSEEASLFINIYRSAARERRRVYQRLSMAEERQKKLNSRFSHVFNEDKETIKAEFIEVCEEALDIANKISLKHEDSNEVKAELYCIKADCLRYLAENGDEAAGPQSHEAYLAGIELVSSLPPCNATVLLLNLNLSVLYYEILNQKGKSRDLAVKTFDEALTCLDELDDRNFKESSRLLEIIKSNLQIWSPFAVDE